MLSFASGPGSFLAANYNAGTSGLIRLMVGSRGGPRLQYSGFDTTSCACGIDAELLDAALAMRNPLFRLGHKPGSAYIFPRLAHRLLGLSTARPVAGLARMRPHVQRDLDAQRLFPVTASPDNPSAPSPSCRIACPRDRAARSPAASNRDNRETNGAKADAG